VISGIAGAYPASELNIGDIAIAEKEINADEGLLISCDEEDTSFLFINHEEVPLSIPEFAKNMKKGIFLTVSASTGNLRRAKFLERKFNALCENMEGFAIAKSAQTYNIPAIEIRSISNIVTDRFHLLKFDDIKKSAHIVQRFILDNIPYFS
jgi:futalosine hydrolase